jgi:hypothetical protein
MRHRLLLTWSCLALALPGAAISAQRSTEPRTTDDAILGRWRIVRTFVAPWVRQARSVNPNRRWVGLTVTFAPQRVDGPGVLRCGRARYTPTRVPADGLFQSALTAPLADAEALGLVSMPVPGTRLSCDSGVFEFHRADQATMLVALDNVIYWLSRAPGALAADTSPAGVVERLLEHHFAGSMAFDAAHLAYHAQWLTPELTGGIKQYLAKPSDPSEVPAINGDPFTDSQEYPTRFAVGSGTVRGDAAVVPVRFSYGLDSRLIEYLLRHERWVWLVNDLRYPRRGTLRRLLR